MRNFLLLLGFWMSGHTLLAQTITRGDQPRFKVEQSPYDGSNLLMVTFGVTLSDCIKLIIVRNIDNNRTYHLKPGMDDYYARNAEEGEEDIYTKMTVGKFKKIVTNKYGIRAEITVISKSGKPIYKGRTEFKIEREDSEDESSADASKTASR
jgi:hypothetical protein